MSKRQHNGNHDISLDYITTELQNGNADRALDYLQTSLNEINNCIRNIKETSDTLNDKLTQLQQHNTFSIAIKEISNLNNNINYQSTNIITKYFYNNNDIDSDSSSLYSSHTETNSNECSLQSRSITLVTDRHTAHHRTQTFPENININQNKIKTNINDRLSRHGSKEEITRQLESGGTLLALLNKTDGKRLGKNEIIQFLEKKGVSQTKINEAYDQFYKQNNLYQIAFTSKPLGFSIKRHNGQTNAMVSSICTNIKQARNIQIGSIIYEINGKRVDGKKYEKIVELLQMQLCPFYVIFKYIPNIIHEHSIINSVQYIIHEANIDWECVGQILLDHTFLPSQRLINQAIDQLERYCDYEDIYENNWRDEICKAWSLSDDRGTVLWQILYGNLKYSEKERRLFYDLMLHFYFELNDMKTENIIFLCTKILRDMKLKHIDLINMKRILVINKMNGYILNNETKNVNDFIQLFDSMEHMNRNVWKELYNKLLDWNLDENIRQQHEAHQRKYKNKLIHCDESIEWEESYNEITAFNDITRVSIREGINYENSIERAQWIAYRHNLRNIFRFFAGWNASHISKKELKHFLNIFGIKQFWDVNLLEYDMISMDEFITYLCNEYINNKSYDIKENITNQTEWLLLLNILKYLEEIDNETIEEGILDFNDFQTFGRKLTLNDKDIEKLFNEMDKNDMGTVAVDEVFKWFRKRLLAQYRKNKSKHKTHSNKKHRGNISQHKRHVKGTHNNRNKHKDQITNDSNDNQFIIIDKNYESNKLGNNNGIFINELQIKNNIYLNIEHSKA